MSFSARTSSAASATICAALLAACTNGALFGPSSQLRLGSVTAIVRRDAIPDGVSLQCVTSPGSVALSGDEQIAVVRMRVGRGPYDEAFALPDGPTVQVGDIMIVHPQLCAIRPAPKKVG